MRLWHERLLRLLPRQQLLGQHRECCALRGNSWGRKHSVVDYVFQHAPCKLVQYHFLVMKEMERRGYRVDPSWYEPYYRGKACEPWSEQEFGSWQETSTIYAEHDEQYLQECLSNLRAKGIEINL